MVAFDARSFGRYPSPSPLLVHMEQAIIKPPFLMHQEILTLLKKYLSKDNC